MTTLNNDESGMVLSSKDCKDSTCMARFFTDDIMSDSLYYNISIIASLNSSKLVNSVNFSKLNIIMLANFLFKVLNFNFYMLF